jgi:hypothetical protein
MKQKHGKSETAKSIPENAIVACGPFYEVDSVDCTENGFLVEVLAHSGPKAVNARAV